MAWFNDNVMDNGVSWLDSNITRIDICSQEPTTYAEATTTYTLANKTSASVGTPTDHSPDGRKVVIAAITDGSVTATDTGTHWAASNGTDTLCATGALSSSQALTSGNTFTLDAIDCFIRDAA